MGIISSLLNLGGQALSNWQNYQYTTQTNEQQFAYQKAMQDYAYQKNLRQWERENAYNDPSEQMKRLENAGLNPNLVYGNGATTLSARSPQYKAPDVHMEAPKAMPLQVDFDIMQTIKDIQGSKNMKLQNDAMQEDITSKKIDNAIKIATQDTEIQKRVEELTGMKLSNAGRQLDNEHKVYDNVIRYIEAENKEYAQEYEQGISKLSYELMKHRTDLTYNQALDVAAAKALKDGQKILQDLEIDARKNGYSWSDSVFRRKFIQEFEKLGTYDSLGGNLFGFLRSLFFGLLGILK